MMTLYDIRSGASFRYNDDNKQNGGHHDGKDSIGHRRIQRYRQDGRTGTEKRRLPGLRRARWVDRMADLEKDGITLVRST